jgi:hypothetical protein
MTATGEVVEPGPERASYERLYSEVYTGLYPALREPLGRLRALRQS